MPRKGDRGSPVARRKTVRISGKRHLKGRAFTGHGGRAAASVSPKAVSTAGLAGRAIAGSADGPAIADGRLSAAAS